MPVPGPDEVRVRVVAVGVNSFDWNVAEGALADTRPYVYPFVPGVDFAGVVDAVGSDVTLYRVGQPVYGQAWRDPMGAGSYAEYVLMPQQAQLALAPERVPLEDAAAVPNAAMTALYLLDQADVCAGEVLVIVGASGGIGSFLIQLAAQRGLRVVAITRSADHGRMSDLGAMKSFATAEGDAHARIRAAFPNGVDALIDVTSGTEDFARYARLMREGGSAISATLAATPEVQAGHGVRAVNAWLEPSSGLLQRLNAEFDAGRLKVDIERRLPLEDAALAWSMLRTGPVRGKTVLLV